jgi:hypothetical protein
LARQSGRKFTSAVQATRASDGKIQEYKVALEIRLDPPFNSQSFQSGMPPPRTQNFKLNRTDALREWRQPAT